MASLNPSTPSVDPTTGATILAPQLTKVGPLQDPDANGIRLPVGFTSRVIAESGVPVVGDIFGLLTGPLLGYQWHTFPDGGAVFPDGSGGWAYVSNSESVPGGVGVLRFNAQGQRTSATRILSGTSANCAGGPTPWGTWLSCEEIPTGRVHETFPFGTLSQAQALPALGIFDHEAVAVDPVRKRIYLTEDDGSARFYRFTPSASDWPAGASRPAMRSGVLEVMQLWNDSAKTDLIADSRELPSDAEAKPATWVPAMFPDRPQTEARRSDATVFAGSEGIWYIDGLVYFTCKSGNRVWVHDVVKETVELIYVAEGDDAPLRGVDNCVVYTPSRELLVAEDGGAMRISAIGLDGSVVPIVQVIGQDDSEITGPAFSPDGTRLYFSSQRGGRFGSGITYEVLGPFNTSRLRSV